MTPLTLADHRPADRRRHLAHPHARRRPVRWLLRRAQRRHPRRRAGDRRHRLLFGARAWLQQRVLRRRARRTCAGSSCRTTTTTTWATSTRCSSCARTPRCVVQLRDRRPAVRRHRAPARADALDRRRRVVDLGDRDAHWCVRPMFDSPATRGLYDTPTGCCGPSTASARFFPGEVYDADDIPADVYDPSFELLNTLEHPVAGVGRRRPVRGPRAHDRVAAARRRGQRARPRAPRRRDRRRVPPHPRPRRASPAPHPGRTCSTTAGRTRSLAPAPERMTSWER